LINAETKAQIEKIRFTITSIKRDLHLKCCKSLISLVAGARFELATFGL
jgi:hypothetical protein